MKWEEVESTIKFWIEVKSYEDSCGLNPFNDLACMAIRILSLPYSNAEVERVFSAINSFKSKVRNRMSLASVNSLLHIKNGLRRENCCCEDYKIPDEVNMQINTLSVYEPSEFNMISVIWPKDMENNEENVDCEMDI